jgi:uncharacterized membrane protein YidH (DUF202 family)
LKNCFSFALQSTFQMKNEQDYIRDIAEIRSMMERSSRFLSLSGWAGIMAGIYALAGAFVAWKFMSFNPDSIAYTTGTPANLVLLGIVILALAIGTAIADSFRKARKRGEKAWNITSKRLLASMAVPLVTGGILVVILVLKGLMGLIAPLTLVFMAWRCIMPGVIPLRRLKFWAWLKFFWDLSAHTS